ISWVRHRDIHLLTVGRDTYTSDQRFQAVHKPHTDDWTLQIKYPQERDSGVYECQISTTPPIGHFVHLIVVRKFNFIYKISITLVIQEIRHMLIHSYMNQGDSLIRFLGVPI
ncbi:unnamed protein product, partial [Allacma fusca]